MLPAALLYLLPVVVVDVAGDRLDPDHTRKLVEHELSVTAVAPDDPRAAEATGRVWVTGNAKDGTLTVKYRKQDEPIERKIALPPDPHRAETDAVNLVGNLARDEASELVPAESKPEPKTREREPDVDSDTRDLAQMRSFLSKSADEEESSRNRVAVGAFALSAAVLVPTVYFEAQGDNVSESGEAFRVMGAGTAGLLAIGGALTLMLSLDHEPLARKINERSARGDSPGKILYEVEHDWEATAKRERLGRHIAGGVSIGLGVLLVGLATVATFADGPRSDAPPVTPAIYFSGAVVTLIGLASIGIETKVESTYRAWKTVKSDPARDSARVSFGVGSVAVTW